MTHQNLYRTGIWPYWFQYYDVYVGIKSLFGLLLFGRIIVQSVSRKYFFSVLCFNTDAIHLSLFFNAWIFVRTYI